MRHRATLATLIAGATLFLVRGPPAAPAAPHPFQLGLADVAFGSPDAALRTESLGRAGEAGADLALVGVNWASIAPRAPGADFDAVDPADPAYDWVALDGAVRDATAAELVPVLDINGAPAWAEGPGRPSAEVAPPGTWRPQPAPLGAFARALAARYSGAFPDPGGSGPLPRVRYYQVWAEQNLSLHLNPLWEGSRLVGPAIYREMLNAVYAEVHAANPGARVIVGGLAPYGDAVAGGSRVPPVWFWRSLLCLHGTRLAPSPCPEPAHFDVAAHNPIDVFGPRRGALGRLDVSVPDIGRLRAIVRRAVATRRALPARPKPFWATEIWWDSRPPDPRGVPVRRQARFLGEAAYELWRQGVSAMIWWFLRDQASGTAGFAATQQSGLLYRDGAAKPAYREFRFPLVARREADGRALLWGKAPSAGPVTLERRRSGGWAPLARATAGPSRVFLVRVAAAGRLQIRARQADEASLPARLATGKGRSVK